MAVAARMRADDERKVLESLSDFALFEIFYETGTQLGGRLYALQRRAREAGDDEDEARWRELRLGLARERGRVDPHDRGRMVDLAVEWGAERERLGALL